ncbi:hypothetical protein LTR47_011667 [Exophiala xenobiotica]|nr:hypothetical protein LTR47_011667 [Exophiala xenobiotica]KAK5242854.1 hypothetical protein LTS06_011237 [Exophiala xenobiotica]KAK5281575.1 hypothetical protein LTR40_004635 [Exophiala xenobiotica]KAK5310348.1 hypothetical protein LTR93_012050 [Exophiala xenobiotica]KAK5344550.1 hypothetical protein LTR61_011679 [Exophiala xenobiotica]
MSSAWGAVQDEEKLHTPRQGGSQPIRQRLNHFTWAWFSTTMGTGSLANVVFQTPYKFSGLVTIGKVIFIIDLVLFVCFTALISRRFIIVHGSFRHSFLHYGEAWFVGTFWVSISLILQGADSFTLLFAIFQYDLLFVTQRIAITGMTPAWILPMYPLIVAGPLAGVLLQHQGPGAGIPIFVAGVTFQGLGWMVTVFLYAIWVIRLFSTDLPVPSLRPGMYVAVGPTAYTAVGMVMLSERATFILPNDFLARGLSLHPKCYAP